MPLNCSTNFRSRILGREAFNDIMGAGCIRFFTGNQPTNADQPEQGILLGIATLNGDNWNAGSALNGLQWAQVGAWMQLAAHSVINPIANGNAGWFRILGNAPDAGGASLSLPRMDGAIGTTAAPAEMTWTDSSLETGSLYPLNDVIFAFPPLT